MSSVSILAPKVRLQCAVFMCAVSSLVFGASSPGDCQDFQGGVALNKTGNVWSYTLTNNEPTNSEKLGAGIFLELNAPVTNILAPRGWMFLSDNESFIEWINDEDSPFPNAVTPGNSLSGFQFESLGVVRETTYFLLPVDSATGIVLPQISGSVLTPTIAASAPEPEAVGLLAMGLTLTMAGRAAQRRKWRR